MITFKKITIMSKAGLVLINYSQAILDQGIQNNGGCPEAAGPDRERLLQPRKYQKYPHQSWLGNWLWALKYREYLKKLYSLDTWCLTVQTNILRSDTTSNRINKQRVLMHGHQGWNLARFVSHLHEICIYIYIYELFIAFVSFVVCSLL